MNIEKDPYIHNLELAREMAYAQDPIMEFIAELRERRDAYQQQDPDAIAYICHVSGYVEYMEDAEAAGAWQGMTTLQAESGFSDESFAETQQVDLFEHIENLKRQGLYAREDFEDGIDLEIANREVIAGLAFQIEHQTENMIKYRLDEVETSRATPADEAEVMAYAIDERMIRRQQYSQKINDLHTDPGAIFDRYVVTRKPGSEIVSGNQDIDYVSENHKGVFSEDGDTEDYVRYCVQSLVPYDFDVSDQKNGLLITLKNSHILDSLIDDYLRIEEAIDDQARYAQRDYRKARSVANQCLKSTIESSPVT